LHRNKHIFANFNIRTTLRDSIVAYQQLVGSATLPLFQETNLIPCQWIGKWIQILLSMFTNL